MGIYSLKKYIQLYIQSDEYQSEMKLQKQHHMISEVCYVDYTSKIYDVVERVTGKLKPELNPVELIQFIIESSIKDVVRQITSNRFFKKFIVAFDYRFITSMNNKFKLSDEIIDICLDKSISNKERVDSNVMLPKSLFEFEFEHSSQQLSSQQSIESLTTPQQHQQSIESSTTPPKPKCKLLTDDIETIYENIRNLYEVRFNYWKPVKSIDKFISVQFVLDNYQLDERTKSILTDSIRIGLTRYILIRGAKTYQRRSKPESVTQSKQDISIRLYESNENEFDSVFKEYFESIPYGLIINLTPLIINLIKSSLDNYYNSTQDDSRDSNRFSTRHNSNHQLNRHCQKPIVEFIGCEDESDYAIARHISKHNSFNYPTVYTKDTDFMMLLCKHECVIKFPYNILPNPIVTTKFWRWLLNTEQYSYSDVVSVCCMMGTSYNRSVPGSLKIKTLDQIRRLHFNGTLFNDVHQKSIRIIRNNSNVTHNRTIEFILALEIYLQSDLIETEVHYIDPNLNLLSKKSNEQIQSDSKSKNNVKVESIESTSQESIESTSQESIESINQRMSNFFTDKLLNR